MKRVIIESPYAGDIQSNLNYARRAMSHSIHMGEAPLASHLLYTQPGILRDEIPDERRLGIECGYTWWRQAELIAFYEDLGWSPGMDAAMTRALMVGIPYEIRSVHKLGVVKRGGDGAQSGGLDMSGI